MIKLRIFFLLYLFHFGKAAKILAIFPVPMVSHYTIASTVLKELVSRGHEVTVINPYTQKSPIQNFTDISIDSIHELLIERRKQLYDLEQQNFFQKVEFFSSMGYALTEATIKHRNVQELMASNKKYDLVLCTQFLNEGLLGIAAHFKAPVVLMSTMPIFPWARVYLGHPSPPSYHANVLSTFTSRMDFWERLINTLQDSYAILYHWWFILPMHAKLVKNFVPSSPNLYPLLNNASLVLLNTDASIYDAVPYPPNAIEVGGLHVQPAKRLPHNLEKYLNESTNGVVYFSMGSNLKSADFHDGTRNQILKVFSKLKQNVLWKWEAESMPNQPKNVKLMKWLPQSDVLGHPNVKAFISHGGLLSTMESVYHGVPIVGIPIFADQKMNIATAVASGYATAVNYREITEVRLTHALDQILNNPQFKSNVETRSRIMKEQPMQPLKRALYWIEYVIKHGGASHLRYAGLDLAWYQQNLLDVIGFCLILILFTLFSICKVISQLKCIDKDVRKQNKIKSH